MNLNALITKIIHSFDNSKDGFSARKLTAFTLTACVVYMHARWVEHDNVAEVLIIDLSTVLLLLGIVTAEQIIRLKNGNKSENESEKQ